MGDCKFCGEPAGFMRKQHGECKERHDSGMDAIMKMCVSAALHSQALRWLTDKIRETAAPARVPMGDVELRDVLVRGWCDAVEASIRDHALSAEEKRGLNRYRAEFGLNTAELDANGHFALFSNITLLNTIVERRFLPRYDRERARAKFGQLPFNLMKGEEFVWVANDVAYVEQVTFSEVPLGVGSYEVARGVYQRPDTSRAATLQFTSMVQTDAGMLGITTKHIYFSGSQKSFRLPLQKIVFFKLYANGVSIMRDTARAKPEGFRMDSNTAWFTVNVIGALLDAGNLTLPGPNTPTLDEILEAGLNGEEDEAHLFASHSRTALFPGSTDGQTSVPEMARGLLRRWLS